jgi:hypothetical protein
MIELAKYLKLPEAAITLLEKNVIASALILAVFGVILAFWGFKFVKIALIVGSAAGAGIATDMFLVPLFAEKVSDISIISVTGLAIVVAAAIGAVLAFKAPRFIVFCGGAAAGYFFIANFVIDFVLKTFASVEFLKNDIVKIVMAALVALIVAIIVSAFFKFLFILGTSFGGAALLVASIITLALTKDLTALLIPAAAVCAVIAIIGMICQYVRGDAKKLLYY